MKRNGIINADISRVLSYMGHTDTLAVGDCGLPIPDETERIDLSLKLGVPSFMEVLREVAKEMKIEKVVLAEEIQEKNPEVLQEILALVSEMETECAIEYISHAELKAQTKSCKAVIRTGETTPYANIILQSACLF
ncbi:MAG: D-ribose pyranase [Lachnospiraceae bacterium]|jgi:ABC-type ribose transport system, auxiliary component|nr:D-ribose pyranase [Lachnospiraceae bacterium]